MSGTGTSSEPIELPAIDSPPKSGAFVDIEGETLTEAEREEGNRLGQEIDIDDDNDNGLKP